MALAPSDSVRATSSRLDLLEILNKPTSELLGVSTEAAAALATVGIKTIFDLSASNLFASARAILDFSKSDKAGGSFIPHDFLSDDASYAAVDEIAFLPVANLRAIPSASVGTFASALDVATIRDLAMWPPALAARSMVGDAFGGTVSAEDLQTEELRPRMGQYPTERVYYATLVMLQQLDPPTPRKLKELSGPLSLDSVLDGAQSPQPAVGALLTFSQSWYSQGVTLGHMLHSLALAPGEATRIAVIDWSRRQRATATEDIAESEQLDSASAHARALSEVQQAVADDFQAGGSHTSSESTSTAGSAQMAVGTGFLTSLFASADISGVIQSAGTSTSADSASWSTGSRAVLGSMAQNVNDRTEQHSSSVRSRRASAVREVSQTEHEQVSTRIVANYNHMHALTVQYYEVVQLYRTEVRLSRADRCLFVPMEILDFTGKNGERYLDRFRWPLARAALTQRIASLLLDETTSVEIKPFVPIIFLPINTAPRDDYTIVTLGAMTHEPADSLATDKTTRTARTATPPPQKAPKLAWDMDRIATLSQRLSRPLMRAGSSDLHLPDQTGLWSISFEAIAVKSVRLQFAAGKSTSVLQVSDQSGEAVLREPVELGSLTGISLKKSVDDSAEGQMILTCQSGDQRFSVPPIPIKMSAGTEYQQVISIKTDRADRRKEILRHLQEHREYYSRAIYQSLDSAGMSQLLSAYKFDGKSLNDIVEPKPVRIVGNYVILRAPVSGDEMSGLKKDGKSVGWNAYLQDRGLVLDKPSDARLIPIPTGGVFAEAVLGRSNAAEKLDITRFWNWQDSPIPLTPTEIQPVGTGSRGTPEDLKPGSLSQPVLNIVNPTTLPQPDSIGTVMSALSNLNFRDQSGLEGTISLAKAGMQGTLDAATDAGQIASSNLRTEAQKAVSMGQIAADIVKAALGGGGTSSVAGISGDGARINHGRSMDERGIGKTPPGAGDTTAPTLGGGSGSSSTGVSPGSGSAGSSASGGGSGGQSSEKAYADEANFGFSPDAVNAVTAPYQFVSATSPAAPSVPDATQTFVDFASSTTFTDGLNVTIWFSGTQGDEFLNWFNKHLANKGAWAGKRLGRPGQPLSVVAERFEKIWALAPLMFSTDHFTLVQFCCLMSIFINEVGGDLLPITEGVGRPGHPGLAYPFDAIPGVKDSYNKPSNKTAYQCFTDPDFIAAHGHLAPASQLANPDRAIWSGQVYPQATFPWSLDPAQTGFIQEADFYKFRGRGYIQATWREMYLRCITFVKGYTGNNAKILDYKHRWGSEDNNKIATRSTNADWDDLFQNSDFEMACKVVALHNQGRDYLDLSTSATELNGRGPHSIYNMGYRISGGKDYAELYRTRVLEMFRALGNAAPVEMASGGSPGSVDI